MADRSRVDAQWCGNSQSQKIATKVQWKPNRGGSLNGVKNFNLENSRQKCQVLMDSKSAVAKDIAFAIA
ncbi:MAG: hypothetical protein PUP93_20370 [Rhizonema sp. NSF051]|nr:hypothetical protein [Rhizonema sp. NSF051]